MAIVVEDGSLVTGANSFVSRADYIAYAASIGVTIADAAAADYELIKAGEFINQHEDRLKGYRVSRDQAMSFPRYDVFIDDWSWTHTEIPRNVILCQLALALDVHDGHDLWNPSANPSLVARRERVEGAVEVEYAISGTQAQKLSRSSKADALLNSLLNNSGLGIIQLVRA